MNKYEKIDCQELWEYDETSPSCLRWKVEIRTGADGRRKLISVGDSAGTLEPSGRYAVRFGGVNYIVARVVWVLHHGCIDPTYVVDHIDGNPCNNRLSNLRLVDRALNKRNSRRNKNNTSGETGVYLNGDYWTACWVGLDGAKVMRYFPIKLMGSDEAKAAAIALRQESIEQLNSLGAGYTDRHGL